MSDGSGSAQPDLGLSKSADLGLIKAPSGIADLNTDFRLSDGGPFLDEVSLEELKQQDANGVALGKGCRHFAPCTTGCGLYVRGTLSSSLWEAKA